MNARKLLVGTIAVVAGLAILPVAQARFGDDMVGPQRSAGLVASSGVRPDDRAGARGPGSAPVQSAARPDDRAGVRGPGSVPVHSAVAATGDGFDWVDALVGGAGGLATALLLMGGALLLLTQRNKTRTA
jgi:hypothetical protein